MIPNFSNPLAKLPDRSESRAIELLAEARAAANEPSKPNVAEWLRNEAWHIAAEYFRRTQNDGLRLYKALPHALAFHKSHAHIRLATGSNQGGKSQTNFAETVRIARGWHKWFPERHGLMLCVGLDLDHISQNMWAMMTLPGQFDIVPDEHTAMMRAVRPDPNNPEELDPIDLARKELWRPAPPLLPQEEWDWHDGDEKGIHWEDKGAGAPRVVTIRSTRWKMLWHPSGGNPRRGIKLNYAIWDEEIANSQWFYETLPRLLRYGGRAAWSVTPQDSYVEALKLHQRAVSGDKDVDEFFFPIDRNPYIPKENKAKLFRILSQTSDDELRSRYFGEWGALSRRIYPDFDMTRLSANGFN